MELLPAIKLLMDRFPGTMIVKEKDMSWYEKKLHTTHLALPFRGPHKTKTTTQPDKGAVAE